MNDIIQDLEVNATNGKENFCYISEKQLKAMKELSKREAKENKQLKDNWNKLKEYMTDAEQIYKESDDKYVKDMREMGIRHTYKTILYKMQDLEQGSDGNE